MSDWIEPTRAIDKDAKIRAIAAALFGDAWCTLVYDVRSDLEPLAILVANRKPEFVSGRLTSSQEQLAHTLPDLA